MISVQFNGSKAVYNVDFKRVSPTVIQLTGKKVPQKTSGFKVYRLNGDFLGDYSEYTRIVKTTEEGVLFGTP